MVFERLLFGPCLLPGCFSFKENKASISINPQPGETILFFNIDDQSNRDCALRNDLWKGEEGRQMCDLMVFYAKKDRRVLCFVELKNSKADFGKAIAQIENTCAAVKSKLRLADQFIIQAFVMGHHGASPMRHDAYQKRLKALFAENFIFDGKATEFSSFLRGEMAQIKSAKEKRKMRKR